MSGKKAKGTIVNNELSQLDKLQNWYEENGNMINIVSGVVLLLVISVLAYKLHFQPKKEIAGQNAIFKAQTWFEQDSISKALNHPINGFLAVSNDYGSTKAGNLAKYYAGLCYYDLGDFGNAETYLSKFYPGDDDVLGGLAIATLADAQMENGKTEAALKNYKKAANFSDNLASAPFLLFKAGLAYDYAGKSSEALEFFEKLKKDFPESDQAKAADKYIGKLNAAI